MRVAPLVAVIGLLCASCSDNDSDGRFELEGEELHGTESGPEGQRLVGDWRMASAAVVEAPAVATAGDTVEVVVELRNPSASSRLSLEPCPTWEASISAENTSLSTRLAGELPCDALKEIEAGRRVRFEITIRAPVEVDCRDGYDPDFHWSISDGDGVVVDATPVNIPMREDDSAAPNDCGGRAGTTVPPPDLERT